MRNLTLVGVLALSALAMGQVPKKAAEPPKPRLVLESGGPSEQVMRVAFTNDGNTLIVFSRDDTVRCWDMTTGEQTKIVRLGRGFPQSKLSTGATVGSLIAVGREDASAVDLCGIGDEPIFLRLPGMEGKIVEEDGKQKMVVTDGHGQGICRLDFLAGKQAKLASADRGGEVYIVDFSTSRKWRLAPRGEGGEVHKGRVTGLQFSPDGKLLVTSGVDGKAWLWAVDKPGTKTELRGHKGAVTSACWSPNGAAVATACADGTIRLWSPAGDLKKEFPDTSAEIQFLAFTSDSTEVISTKGLGERKEGCEIRNIETGKVRLTFREHAEGIGAGAVSPNGKYVASVGWLTHQILVWDPATGKVVHRLGTRSTITSGAGWSKDGKTIAWSTDTTFSERASLPNPLARLTNAFDVTALGLVGPPAGPFLRGEASNGLVELVLADDGKRVSVRNLRKPGPEVALQPPTGRLGADKPQFARPRAMSVLPGSRAVVADDNGLHMYDTRTGRLLWGYSGLAGQVYGLAVSPDERFLLAACDDRILRIWNLEEATAGGLGIVFKNVAGSNEVGELLPDGGAAVDGRIAVGDRVIAVEDAEGAFVDLTPPAQPKEAGPDFLDWIGKTFSQSEKRRELLRGVVGTTVRVRLIPAGKTDAVTLAVKRRDEVVGPVRGAPVVSLFVVGDEWVMWCDEGYYASSPKGDSLIAWVTDDDPEKQLPTVHAADKFRASLYRPDVIRAVLRTGNLDVALAEADKKRGVKTEKVDVSKVLPPVVIVTAPKPGFEFDDEACEVSVVARSVGDHPITGLRVLVDGRPVGPARKVTTPKLGEVRETWRVALEPGEHRLKVLADSAVSQGESGEIRVTRAKTKDTLPKLHIVAVGISEYQVKKLKLNFAASDANSLATAFRTHAKPLFHPDSPEPVVLTDKGATRAAVLKTLRQLAKDATARDVVVVFFAGHGDKDEKGRFYFLPTDTDPTDLLSTAISSDDLKAALAGLPGRVLVLLDACHAGALTEEKRRGGLTDDLIRELKSDDSGIITMCSSRGGEVSKESPEHKMGFFTLALVEGLSGKARRATNGAVYLSALDDYVVERVKSLSGGTQHPVSAKGTSIGPLPLTKPE